MSAVRGWLGLVALGLGLACGAPSEPAATPERVAAVELGRVDRGTVEEVVEGWGTVEFPAAALREVTAPRGGEVRVVSAVEGQRVRSGAGLVVLGPMPESFPEVEQARIALAFALRSRDRVRRMAAEHLATNADVERAEREVQSVRAKLRNLGAAAPEPVEIAAPADGVVVEVRARAGASVRPGEPLVVVASGGSVAVRAGFELETLDRLDAGQPVRIVPIFGGGGRRVEARLPRLHARARSASQVVETLIPVDAPPPWLLPGERVRVRVVVKADPGAMRIPREAIVTRAGEPGCFVVRDGRASWTAVEILITGESLVAVRGALEEGDAVATTGRSSLEDRMRVRAASRMAAP